MNDTEEQLINYHVTADFDCGTLTVDWNRLADQAMTDSEILDHAVEIVRANLVLAELVDWKVDMATKHITVYHVNVRLGCAIFRAGFGCFQSSLSESELLEEAVNLLRAELNSPNFDNWTVV